MKKNIFALMLTCCSTFLSAQNSPRAGANAEQTIRLPVSVFQNEKDTVVDGKTIPGRTVFSTGIVLNDVDAARIINSAAESDIVFREWLQGAILEEGKNGLQVVEGSVKKRRELKENSNRAVIIVQHQLNPKKLNPSPQLEKERAELCARYCALQNDTQAIAACHKSLLDGKCVIPSTEKLDFIRYLEARFDSDIVKMNRIEAEYKLTGGGLVEMEPIVSYIYHFDEYGNHSDYLLGVDDIYVILIGGTTDIAASSISTKRTANRNETDFAAAGKIASGLFTGNPELVFKQAELTIEPEAAPPGAFFAYSKGVSGDSCAPRIARYQKIIDSLIALLHPHPDCELEVNYKSPTMQAAVLHLDPSQLHLPGDIIITPLGKTAITISLHARQWCGVQAGMLGSSLALRNYTLNNDTLNVSIPFEKTKWDALPFIVVQIYPGRDIDRLSPLRWHRNYRKVTWYLRPAFFLRNRLGVYGGFRISKQPIQTLTCGFSFALGPNVNLHAGWMWNRTLDVTENYYLGDLQDEKRLEEFAPTTHLQTFTIGISVSPGIYKDWFGN